MRWFLELRRSGNPLALVGLYAAGVALMIAWTGALPGKPSYGADVAPVVAISLAVLVVFFMARGAWAAWRLALFAHIFGFALSAPAAFGAYPAKSLGLAILQALVLLILFAPALERHVGARR